MSPFAGGGPDADAVVRRIQTACLNIGFFVVTGHGVDPGVTDRLYRTARAFFDQPEGDKRSLIGRDRALGGLEFAPLLQEALAATQGVATPGDIKESINFGTRLEGSSWPSQHQELHAACMAYFAEMERLAKQLRHIFCAAIGLAPDHFEPGFAHHLSALRIINYPAQTEAPLAGQLRAGTHTDYGFMTILRSEASAGGLQVQRRDGTWIDAPAIDNAFVVNIADAFMRWTNDTWVSTPHRVINPPQSMRGSARRQSIAFFVNPSNDTRIECLPAFCPPGTRPRYDPVSFQDYIELKTRQAFAAALS
ncbi:MAG: isopenicillin N synthase family oxygenase [Rhodoferax sp.]|nr:isopenicillin N synthase family oxygenase [Rhodoferax sp.]